MVKKIGGSKGLPPTSGTAVNLSQNTMIKESTRTRLLKTKTEKRPNIKKMRWTHEWDCGQNL